MAKQGVYKWSAIDRIGSSAMTFAGNIVLARLLDPADFGLVAMVAIFGAIAQNLSNCGLSDGIIHKPSPTERDYSTVMVFNAATGLILGALLALLGRPLSIFFNREAINGIMVAIGICFFFGSLCFIQETRLRKELDFRKMAQVRLLSTASATALGITLAANGFGYWALIATQSGLSIFMFIYYIAFTRWIPALTFYRTEFKQMFSYGWHLMVAYIALMIGRNLNTMFLGRYATPTASGFYSQGYKLQEVPFILTESIFNWPFFSVLSNTPQAEQPALCQTMHKRMWAINGNLAMLLLLVSWPLFNLLYGAKWDASIPVFRLLLVYGSLASMMYFYQTVMKAAGQTKLVRNLTIAQVLLQIILLAVTIKLGVSLIMVALTLVVATIIITGVHAIWYARVQHLGFARMAGEICAPLILPAVSTACTFALMQTWYQTASPLWSCMLICITYLGFIIIAGELLKPPYYMAARQTLLQKSSKLFK